MHVLPKSVQEVHAHACGGPKSTLEPLELELQMVVMTCGYWGTELSRIFSQPLSHLYSPQLIYLLRKIYIYSKAIIRNSE